MLLMSIFLCQHYSSQLEFMIGCNYCTVTKSNWTGKKTSQTQKTQRNFWVIPFVQAAHGKGKKATTLGRKHLFLGAQIILSMNWTEPTEKNHHNLNKLCSLFSLGGVPFGKWCKCQAYLLQIKFMFTRASFVESQSHNHFTPMEHSILVLCECACWLWTILYHYRIITLRSFKNGP